MHFLTNRVTKFFCNASTQDWLATFVHFKRIWKYMYGQKWLKFAFRLKQIRTSRVDELYVPDYSYFWKHFSQRKLAECQAEKHQLKMQFDHKSEMLNYTTENRALQSSDMMSELSKVRQNLNKTEQTKQSIIMQLDGERSRVQSCKIAYPRKKHFHGNLEKISC